MKYGYNVIQVIDGEQAIQETLKQKPSVVVVDLKMPKKDGFEVCLELKKDKKHYFPILLLTAKEDIESLVQGLESGADDYIIKPFNEMEFIARINVLLRLKKLNTDLLLANRRLKYLSTHDELTDLYNHGFFISIFDRLLKEASKEKSNLCFAIFDVDYFKRINDTYGHLEGDNVLKKIGMFLQDSFTTNSILARYGGEEFTAIFPNRELDFVVTACQKVIDDCQKLDFLHDKIKHHVTLSAGISSTECINSYNILELIQSADKLLYHSKNTGRNRLSFYDQYE